MHESVSMNMKLTERAHMPQYLRVCLCVAHELNIFSLIEQMHSPQKAIK